jgi:hypothetical protein
MEEKTHNDLLAHMQAKCDALPPGTVFVPPEDGVKSVQFGDLCTCHWT